MQAKHACGNRSTSATTTDRSGASTANCSMHPIGHSRSIPRRKLQRETTIASTVATRPTEAQVPLEGIAGASRWPLDQGQTEARSWVPLWLLVRDPELEPASPTEDKILTNYFFGRIVSFFFFFLFLAFHTYQAFGAYSMVSREINDA